MGMSHWDGHDAGFAILASVQVPDLAVVLGAFATGDLPGGALTPGIGQVIAGGPAHDEAHLVFGQFLEPGCASEAPVEDMDHASLPTA